MAAAKLEVAPPPTAAEEAEAKLVADLKQKHAVSQVHRFTSEAGDRIYVRMPASGVWRRFRAQMSDERKRPEAAETLLRSCLLHPSQEDFNAMVEARPGLVDLFSGFVMELGGLEKGGEKKAL